MSTTYIIKPPRTNRRNSMRLAETLTAHFGRIHRDTGRTLGGLFREIEDAGPNEQSLEVRTPRETIGLDGRRTGSTRIDISRSQAALDKAIRRIREDDAETLAGIDERIEIEKTALKTLRAMRSEAAYAAWKRAPKVPLREIVDLVDAA